jgi:hypothetical protein
MLSAFNFTPFIFLTEKRICPVILPRVLYACETRVLTIKEEQMKNDNMVLTKISGPNRVGYIRKTEVL